MKTTIENPFERVAQLLGPETVPRLAKARAAIFGLGGVGSFAAEALARSGVGQLTLVDFDRVCPSNINRQLHALHSTIGQYKANLMAERIRAINPYVQIIVHAERYDRHTAARLLDPRPDVVLDCIDIVTSKMHLVSTCIGLGIPMVTSLGAGGRMDPTQVRVAPLTETHSDPLGRALRKHVRRKHRVSNQDLASVLAVFSEEPVIPPCASQVRQAPSCEEQNIAQRQDSRQRVTYGTLVTVTGVFGMTAAATALKLLLGNLDASALFHQADGMRKNPDKKIKIPLDATTRRKYYPDC